MLKKGSYIIIFFCLIVYAYPTFPQDDLKFRHLGMQDGLSQSSVLSIFRDSEGFVWFGTRTGLNRFDGISVKEYLQDPDDPIAINFGFVVSIVEDRESDLWIGSKGLYHYDRSLEKFTRYLNDPKLEQSLGSNSVQNIATDSSGRIWICHGEGLDMYDPLTERFVHILKHIPNDFNLDSSTIFDVTVDDNDRIWFCTDKHLYQVLPDQNRLEQFLIPLNPDSHANTNEIKLHFLHQAQKLLISRIDGQFFSFDENLQRVVEDDLSISTKYPVNSVAEDTEGNILIGTNFGGLFKYYPKTGNYQQYTHDPNNPYSLSTDLIYSVYPDESGTVWIGTWEGGINYTNRFDGFFTWLKHNPYDENSLKSDNLTCFYEDSSGYLWIGSRNGLSCWNRSDNDFCADQIQSDPFGIIENAEITCFFEFEADKIWVGTNSPGGVFEIDINRKQVKAVSLPWESIGQDKKSSILSIKRGANNEFWFSTPDGIYRLNADDQSFTHFTKGNSGLKHNHIVSSFVDANGVFWAGSSSGLYRFNELNQDFEYISSYLDNVDFTDHWVYAMTENDLGQFWVGTGGYGLVLYDRSTGGFRRYTVKDGLGSNVITGIVSDNDGKLWISTYKGITEFDPLTKIVLNNYDYKDGLQNIEFRPGCSYKTRSGEIVFGGAQGLAFFDPSKFISNPYIPNIVFKELEIAYKVIQPGIKRSPLETSLNQSKELVLKFNQNPISFSFAALNLVNASKNKYLCFLEGYDEDWHAPHSPGEIVFENLNPGRYTLHIKASNNSGIWNEAGRSIEIKVKPPWYRSLWAYAIYLTILSLLLFLYAKFVRYTEKEKQKVIIERSEKEKIMALNKARLQFFTGIAHDFKIPLSLIISPIEQLQNYHSSDGKFEKLLATMSRNAKRLNFLIAELMTFRKLEIGELKLSYQDIDIIRFIHDITDEFVPIFKRRNIRLITNLENKSRTASCDPKNMERVLYNLIDNACNYTPEGGLVRISFKPVETNTFQISIYNSGSTFTKEELDRIFDRFYQSNSGPSRSKQSYGIGLALVKGLVELHKGTISVKNEGTDGKEFIVQLPGLLDENLVVKNGHKDIILNPINKPIKPKDSEVFILDNGSGKEEKNNSKALILIVDDDLEMCEYLETNLNGRYTTVTAGDGVEGVASALKEMPDLIISDVTMPNMDGLEFCQKIKQDLRTSHIPVVLLTARSEIEHKLEGLETGADAYITKPFVYKHLETQVRNLIQNRTLLANKFSGKDSYAPDEIHTSKVDQEFLKNAVTFVEENIADEILNIDVLSKHLCVSRRHLHRKIKVLTGSSPVEFINIIRLRNAMELIKENSLTISEIAYQVGFSNPSYFANTFKKLYGHPPSFFQN